MHDNNPIAELVEKLNTADPQPIPENMATIDAMLDHTFEWAQKQLLGSDDDQDESAMVPTWTLLTQSGQVVIAATPFDSGSEGKDMIAEGMKKIMQAAHVIRYTFMSEAWTATQTRDWREGDDPPSERPDRKEILMITGGDRKNGEKVRIYDMIRDADGTVTDLKFNNEMDKGLSEGRFSDMLEVARH